jgi:hypothetical protein
LTSSQLKTTAVVADRVWHITVREEDGGQWLAIGHFRGAILERRANSADGAEKAWIAAARKMAA